MKIKEWVCEVCGQTGEIKHPSHEDVRLIRIRIAEDHQNVSPLCQSLLFKITKGLPGLPKGKMFTTRDIKAIHDRMVLEGGIIPK